MRIPGITLLLTFSAAVASGQTLTLDSCQDQARRNYPLIKQHDLIQKSAEFSISNANKGYLPQVSLTGIGGYLIKGLPTLAPGGESSKDKTQFIGIAQVNQTIWDGGAGRAQKEIVKASAEVESAQTEVALYDIQQRVNQLYFSILLMNEQEDLLEILMQNLDRNLRAVKLSNENGVGYISDVDEVKVEIVKAQQRLVEVQYARKGYLEMLGLMIGKSLSAETQLVKPLTTDLRDENTLNRPELSLYQHQRNLAGSQFAMTRVGAMPKLGLLGAGIMIQPGMAFGPQKIQSLAIAGISLSWNTNSLYKSSNERELHQISIDRISTEEETFRFNTKLQLSQQRSDVEKQRQILAKDDEIVALKSKIKKAYELKYENGVCTMNDLITVTNSENEARANQALHEAQLLMNIYSYKTTSGN